MSDLDRLRRICMIVCGLWVLVLALMVATEPAATRAQAVLVVLAAAAGAGLIGYVWARGRHWSTPPRRAPSWRTSVMLGVAIAMSTVIQQVARDRLSSIAYLGLLAAAFAGLLGAFAGYLRKLGQSDVSPAE